MKTLFIVVDNNPLPEVLSDDILVIDCRHIAVFCSMIGDALVGNLKDDNGKPLYRSFVHLGKLLMDFKEDDKNAYYAIVEDWCDKLGNILHKGIQDGYLTFKFPQQYVDWLINNESPYYEQVGKELQRHNTTTLLSYEDISKTIISSLVHRINNILRDNKDSIFNIIFTNELIDGNSYIVTEINKNESVFCCLNYHDYKLQKLDDISLFRIEMPLSEEFMVLGKTHKDDFDQSDWDWLLLSSGIQIEFKDGICNSLSVYSDEADDDFEKFNEVLSIIWGHEIDRSIVSFNSSLKKLQEKGFQLSTKPKWADGLWFDKPAFMAVIKKETRSFICELRFLDATFISYDLEEAKNKPGTLWSIEILIK